jgi:hypothetical protein
MDCSFGHGEFAVDVSQALKQIYIEKKENRSQIRDRTQSIPKDTMTSTQIRIQEIRHKYPHQLIRREILAKDEEEIRTLLLEIDDIRAGNWDERLAAAAIQLQQQNAIAAEKEDTIMAEAPIEPAEANQPPPVSKTIPVTPTEVHISHPVTEALPIAPAGVHQSHPLAEAVPIAPAEVHQPPPVTETVPITPAEVHQSHPVTETVPIAPAEVNISLPVVEAVVDKEDTKMAQEDVVMEDMTEASVIEPAVVKVDSPKPVASAIDKKFDSPKTKKVDSPKAKKAAIESPKTKRAESPKPKKVESPKIKKAVESPKAKKVVESKKVVGSPSKAKKPAASPLRKTIIVEQPDEEDPMQIDPVDLPIAISPKGKAPSRIQTKKRSVSPTGRSPSRPLTTPVLDDKARAFRKNALMVWEKIKLVKMLMI